MPTAPAGHVFYVLTVTASAASFVELCASPMRNRLFCGRMADHGQVLSAPLVIVGVCVLIYAVRAKKPQQGLPEMVQKLVYRYATNRWRRCNEFARLPHVRHGRFAAFYIAGETPSGAFADREGFSMDVKFFKCMHCGNVVVKVFDQGVPVVCCKREHGRAARQRHGWRAREACAAGHRRRRHRHREGWRSCPSMTEPHFITMIVLVTEKGLPDCAAYASDAPGGHVRRCRRRQAGARLRVLQPARPVGR